MYILQISDLHIQKNDNTKIERKLHRLNECLKQELSNNDKVVCCFLGDIIDKGDASIYDCALLLLNNFIEELSTIVSKNNINICCIPGNHDLCEDSDMNSSLGKFNEFASELTQRSIQFSNAKVYEEFNAFGYNFVSINSIRDNNKEYGVFNDFELKESDNNIALMHHSLLSDNEEDDAAIRNGYKLQKLLDEKQFITLLHGHTHGYKRYKIGSCCQVIGVGPMFKPENDISNKCNLIKITGCHINKIQVATYQADRDIWDFNNTYDYEYENNYQETSICKAYKKILSDIEISHELFNVKICVEQNMNDFISEIYEKFPEEMEEAHLWQDSNDFKDTKLDHTHCEFMNYKDNLWNEMISEKLKNNPTSKRAILPLLTPEMAYRFTDDYLVSFDVVQFGFKDESSQNLMVTLYMRALEVSTFLPINICELYLMADKIKTEIPSINRLTLTIFAFKAERKERYACNKKLEIDCMTESEICKLIQSKNYQRIVDLLKEKEVKSETVVKDDWITKLENAFNDFSDSENKLEIIAEIAKLKKANDKFKLARNKHSNYDLTKKEENEYNEAIADICELISREIHNG